MTTETKITDLPHNKTISIMIQLDLTVLSATIVYPHDHVCANTTVQEVVQQMLYALQNRQRLTAA